MTDQTTTDRDTPSRRAGLRDEIAAALEAADYRMDMRRGDLADAVLPVLHREWPWLRAEAEDATDRAAAPIDWVDGHPQLEAVAAAVWERCEHSDSGLIIDDPRNIAGAALAAVLPAPDQRAAVWLDAATRLWHQTNGLTEYGRGARWAIGELRRLAGEAQQAPCGRPASMATTPCSAGDHCCEGPSEAQQDPTQDGPRRGDWFEQWLVTQRDRHGWQGTNDRVIWDALDTVVGLYRLHADSVTPLAEHVSEEPATGETQQGPAQDGEERMKHSGPGTEFCVLCLSGEHERVNDDAVARSGQPETDEETPGRVECGMSSGRDWWCRLLPGHSGNCIPRRG